MAPTASGIWRRIMRGLVSRHDQIILRRDVVAPVARPADVERLALDGAARHVRQLGDDADLRDVVEKIVVDHRAVDQRKREVAHVDGKTESPR